MCGTCNGHTIILVTGLQPPYKIDRFPPPLPPNFPLHIALSSWISDSREKARENLSKGVVNVEQSDATPTEAYAYLPLEGSCAARSSSRHESPPFEHHRVTLKKPQPRESAILPEEET